MKTKKLFKKLLFGITLLCSFSLHAQVDTKGRDFWVSFGQNATQPTASSVALQIRIVANEAATGTIRFTNTGEIVPFSIAAGSVLTHVLTPAQRDAAYNGTPGVSNRTVRIQSDIPVTVFAFNQFSALACATNVLPVPVLGNSHFHLGWPTTNQRGGYEWDQYMAIAVEDGTNIYENGVRIASNLSAGQMYFRRQTQVGVDMSGFHITSNNPIAYFTAHSYFINDGGGDNIFQQLTPVNTWGRNFFVPVTTRELEYVRVVASEDNTTITQTGGNIAGSFILNTGEWAEFRITLANGGAYIQADRPIQVGSYMVGSTFFGAVPGPGGDEAFVWVPPIEQTVNSALMAPFIAGGLNRHFAMIVTPTATRDNTTVRIGTGEEEPLSGGTWHENAASGMSFYHMLLANNANVSYFFANPAGLIAYGYGFGSSISYYYVAGSGMRTLDVAFFANDVHNQDLIAHPFPTSGMNFRAYIQGDLSPNPNHIRWFIDGVEDVSLRDQLTWSRNFPNGTYLIAMEAVANDNNNTVRRVEGTLIIAIPSIIVNPHIRKLPR